MSSKIIEMGGIFKTPYQFGLFGVLAFTGLHGWYAHAFQFDFENPKCVAKTKSGDAWLPADGAALKSKTVNEVETSENGLTRFKVDSTWYLVQSECIKEDRSPASLDSKSVSNQGDLVKKTRPYRSGLVLRGALEFSSFSRTLGVGSSDYQVSLSTIAAKAGIGKRSFLKSSRMYVGWNLDGFFGISSVASESSSPFTYAASGILTFGSRGSASIGYQVSKRIQSQLDLGAGFSYAALKQSEAAGTSSPKAFGFFPLVKLGSVYQIGSNLGVGMEVMSQGVLRDFGFSGGLQWVL